MGTWKIFLMIGAISFSIEGSLIAITLILLFPKSFLLSRKLWKNFLDTLGLIAFSIKGATVTVKLDLPVSAVVVSALLTGHSRLTSTQATYCI